MPSSASTHRASSSVSVVIPVRNEEGSIAAAIASALGQDRRGDMEVVVADGASTDATVDVIEAAFGDDDRVRVVPNPSGATPSGLNAAILATSGDVIVRCDAHAVLPSGYIARAVDLLESTGADVVGGVQAAQGETLFQRAVAGVMADPMGSGGADYRGGAEPGPVDTVYLGVFRRQALERVGLYDESLRRNQDYELNYRIRSSGGTVYFHPDLRVAYLPRATPQALWSQYWQYGAWKREMLKRDPGAARLRQAAPPALVVGLAASLVLVLVGRRKWATIVPSLYAGAVASTMVRQVGRSGIATALPAGLVVATMHLGWGLGFLLGRAELAEPRIPSLERR